MDMLFAAIVVVLGATGTYLLLPHRHGHARPRSDSRHRGGGWRAWACCLISTLEPSGPFLPTLFFYIFGAARSPAGVLTVTSRNPVYSALWFASVVLSTAGLFLLAGAPFLAAGTIIVYAGAIIVTFLFVIMLAQMEGRADYDRAARSPALATITSFVILWCLVYTMAGVRPGPPAPDGSPDTARNRLVPEMQLLRSRNLNDYVGSYDSPIMMVVDKALSPSRRSPTARGARGRDAGHPVLGGACGPGPSPNVAGLGASLYTDHLVTVALAGALLFVALVGAVAITNPKRPIRPGRHATASA